MNIKEAQDAVKKFDEERGWKDNWELKDLGLNICEEVGELWHLVKWVDNEKQKQVVKENKEEMENFVGDTIYLIFKIANQTGVDVDKAFNDSLNDFIKRFPPEKTKQAKHGNKLAGGIDFKE